MRRLFTLVLFAILALFPAGWGDANTGLAKEYPADPSVANYLPAVFYRTGLLCRPATIVFDVVPPLGSNDDLRGHVTCAAPADYKVAVYIKVSGWWTKPTYAFPLTTIQGDGTWVTDITTGGSDPSATDIAAFLIPNGYNPPILSGGAILPEELYNKSVAYTSTTRRAVRTIDFSGHTWQVKYTPILAGPGPNYFSDDPADVYVDGNGYLHLRIVKRNGIWYSTEVVCTDVLQYGTYSITTASRVDLLDKNEVLGFFTWDDAAPQYNYREIDIEFSRWGEDTTLNAQYVVSPWQVSGNRYRFAMNLNGNDSTHRFDWRADNIQFDSREGNNTLQSWAYTNPTYIPPAGSGNARINFWLLDGKPPSNGQDAEVIVKAFVFTP